MRLASLPIVLAVVLSFTAPALSAPGDTTWVRTFDEDFYNWATPHYDTFTLPDDPALYQKILIYYTIGCPSFPNDCDPWDRLGHLRVVTEEAEIEVARIITPYDITGGGGPGSCTWIINASAYKSILRGEVTLRNYIESWIGGSNGWLVTIDFAFIEGERNFEPYQVVHLWGNDHVIYGNPDEPIPAALPAATVDIPEDVDQVKVRVFTTGHGQGNTFNCAEFCSRTHTVLADGTDFSHILWNTNCQSNPCSPQGGNWSFGRAGWCPGMDAPAWNVDITNAVTPGQSATIQYAIQDYENLCRPSNPECVDGVTCPDCDYNSTGHTRPHYTVQGQVVFYKARDTVVDVEEIFAPEASGVALAQNAPNPFSPSTTIGYSIDAPGLVELKIYDTAGRLVHTGMRAYRAAGEYSYRWDGRDETGRRVASGTYFYVIETGGERQAKKMVLVN